MQMIVVNHRGLARVMSASFMPPYKIQGYLTAVIITDPPLAPCHSGGKIAMSG